MARHPGRSRLCSRVFDPPRRARQRRATAYKLLLRYLTGLETHADEDSSSLAGSLRALGSAGASAPCPARSRRGASHDRARPPIRRVPRFDASQLAKLPRCTEAKRERRGRGRSTSFPDRRQGLQVLRRRLRRSRGPGRELRSAQVVRENTRPRYVGLPRPRAGSISALDEETPAACWRPGHRGLLRRRRRAVSDSVKRILGGWRGTHGGEVRATSTSRKCESIRPAPAAGRPAPALASQVPPSATI